MLGYLRASQVSFGHGAARAGLFDLLLASQDNGVTHHELSHLSKYGSSGERSRLWDVDGVYRMVGQLY